MFQAPTGAPPPAAEPSVLVLTNANLIDGVASRPRRGVTVIVRSGPDRAGDVRARSASGQCTGDRSQWPLAAPRADRRPRPSAEPRERACGVAVGRHHRRSMGVDRFIDVEIAARHRAGSADLPHVVPAGYHVRPRLADAFFTDFPEPHPTEGRRRRRGGRPPGGAGQCGPRRAGREGHGDRARRHRRCGLSPPRARRRGIAGGGGGSAPRAASASRRTRTPTKARGPPFLPEYEPSSTAR